MRYTIAHQGVPVGTLELSGQTELTACDVQPLPAYATIQPTVRAATRALRDLGFLGAPSEPASKERAAAALGHGATLGRALELWDEHGTPVAVDFIDLTDWPDAEHEVVAFVCFRDAAASVAAKLRPPPRAAADGSRPAS